MRVDFVSQFNPAIGMALSGDRLYVTEWDDLLQVLDVTDPSTPVIVNSVPVTIDHNQFGADIAICARRLRSVARDRRRDGR